MSCVRNVLLIYQGFEKHDLICVVLPRSFVISLPKYMAPEVVAEGHVKIVNLTTGMKEFIPSGPKVDIWSLGLILIEAFTVSILHFYDRQKTCRQYRISSDSRQPSF